MCIHDIIRHFYPSVGKGHGEVILLDLAGGCYRSSDECKNKQCVNHEFYLMHCFPVLYPVVRHFLRPLSLESSSEIALVSCFSGNGRRACGVSPRTYPLND